MGFSIQKNTKIAKRQHFRAAATPVTVSKFREQLASFFAAISATIIKDIFFLYKSFLS